MNFQRVPVVDTSNPFIARWIPTADESLVVIRFKSPRGIDFPYLLSMINEILNLTQIESGRISAHDIRTLSSMAILSQRRIMFPVNCNSKPQRLKKLQAKKCRQPNQKMSMSAQPVR